MLLPENASKSVRLQRMAALGASLADRQQPPLSPSTVRGLLKLPDIGGADVLMLEDPYSEPFIRSVSFYGGSYLVSGGSAEHLVSDLEGLLEAAFKGAWLPGDLKLDLEHLVIGLLSVSDYVLRRGGLRRGTPPGGIPRSAVTVPGAARLRALEDATFLSIEQIESASRWLLPLLDDLSMSAGDLGDPCGDDYVDDRLFVKPFLRLDDGYRVMLPLDLGVTIRFHLMERIAAAGLLPNLADGWRGVALRKLLAALPSGAAVERLDAVAWADRYLMTIDDSLTVHVILATDPFADWSGDVWGYFDTSAVLHELAGILKPSDRAAYSSAPSVLHVLIIDSPGRSCSWGIPHVEGADPMLIARSDDIEVICFHEERGVHGLYLFAEAVAKRAGHSLSMSVLDEYAQYVEADHSFYFSDDAPPDFITFQAGDGLYPRLEHERSTDRHGVVLPLPGKPVLPAVRRYERDAPEIYLTLPNSRFVGAVVELGDRDVFLGPRTEADVPAELEMELLDCVAYWVRECALRGQLTPAEATSLRYLVISDPDAWKTGAAGESTAPPVKAVVGADGSTCYEFTAAFLGLLARDSNEAERELVGVVLSELFRVGDEEIAPLVDRVAPIGAKRMLNAWQVSRYPELAQSHLEAITGHGQVTAQVLDELGEWLRSPDGGARQSGAIASTERVRVLNISVAHLLNRLQDATAAFDSAALIEYLIAQNEALLARARRDGVLLPQRLACFGSDSQYAVNMHEERRKIALAHRANRFLIELVAAEPPRGQRAVTVLDYLRILGIAEEIIQLGTASDFINYQLADFEVTILPSGRLGISRDAPVLGAIETFTRDASARAIRLAMGEAPAESDVNMSSLIERSDVAMRAEYGFTFMELREVCGGLLDLASEHGVTRVRRTDAIAEVASARSLSTTTIETVIDAISMTECAPYSGIGPDSFPWRFNRNRSFLARPIVDQSGDLVFGFIGLTRLGVYLADQMLSGRLQGKARTPEMRSFISEIRREVNDAYATSVARRLETLGVRTYTSVKKAGKLRIADDLGRDLGDIDVLGIHAASRTLLAVEAKDFEVARTPAEIEREIRKLFVGTRKKRSTLELHERRVVWLRKHLSDAARAFDLEGDPQEWHVRGLVVTSEPLLSPLVRTGALEIIAFDDLDRAVKEHEATRPRRAHRRRPRRNRKGR